MERKHTQLQKVLRTRDLIALACGAAIGWSWVVLSGGWLQAGGTLGAILGFVLGGIMVLFIGLTYAELCPAMPKCGGEHVFTLRGLGYNWSFVCSWALTLSYFGVVAFEACALPNVLEYIIPNFSQGRLYAIGDMDIYVTYVLVGIMAAVSLMVINYIGVQFASWVQQLFTAVILFVGLLLLITAGFRGNLENTKPLFANGMSGVFSVAVVTPFLMMGFDVIPQTAEEVNLPPKKIGNLMLFSIALTAAWYCIIILSVSMLIDSNETRVASLCTANALVKGWNGFALAKYVVVIGGVCGILSSWNAFLAAGSRVLFAMSESGMIPQWFGKIHPKYKTPSNSILFLGLASCIAPFFGRQLLGWISNAASLTTVIAYGLVAVAFLVLRKKEPNMPRPYRIKHGTLMGWIAVSLAAGMLVLYLPGMPSGLGAFEWSILGIWMFLGGIFYFVSRKRK